MQCSLTPFLSVQTHRPHRLLLILWQLWSLDFITQFSLVHFMLIFEFIFLLRGRKINVSVWKLFIIWLPELQFNAFSINEKHHWKLDMFLKTFLWEIFNLTICYFIYSMIYLLINVKMHNVVMRSCSWLNLNIPSCEEILIFCRNYEITIDAPVLKKRITFNTLSEQCIWLLMLIKKGIFGM